MNEKNDDITFSNLGLKESIIQILSKLDISTPSLIQQKTIPEVLQNKNVVFESETGTGKTFAYLLPLIQNLENCKSNEDKIIILAPTYELASQIKLTASQVTSLKASLFIGGTPIKRQIEVLKDKPQIIIGNPSRILELIHLKHLMLELLYLMKQTVLSALKLLMKPKNLFQQFLAMHSLLPALLL